MQPSHHIDSTSVSSSTCLSAPCCVLDFSAGTPLRLGTACLSATGGGSLGHQVRCVPAPVPTAPISGQAYRGVTQRVGRAHHGNCEHTVRSVSTFYLLSPSCPIPKQTDRFTPQHGFTAPSMSLLHRSTAASCQLTAVSQGDRTIPLPPSQLAVPFSGWGATSSGTELCRRTLLPALSLQHLPGTPTTLLMLVAW